MIPFPYLLCSNSVVYGNYIAVDFDFCGQRKRGYFKVKDNNVLVGSNGEISIKEVFEMCLSSFKRNQFEIKNFVFCRLKYDIMLGISTPDANYYAVRCVRSGGVIVNIPSKPLYWSESRNILSSFLRIKSKDFPTRSEIEDILSFFYLEYDSNKVCSFI